MSALDRILLTLLSLAGLCTAAGAFLVAGGALSPFTAMGWMTVYPGNVWGLAGSVVLAVLAVRFLFYRWGRREPDYVLLPGEHGHIRISHDTIRQLANRTGKSVRGVQDFDTRIRSGNAGVLLSVRVRALPDLDLARMSAEIQDAVKAYVEKTAGVPVERVIVNVTEIAGGPSSKPQRGWGET
ncbi:MAG: alkaline shock response membrane anchor protein AmaP [Alicyclobacillus sp.]|nr:alkaline shock response membrane anchor protein AmaP [Alicyclobacillus sp.]